VRPLFQRRIENFDCAECGLEVRGTGYTNHCPRCLWSRHVDIDPGDRRAACRGMMRPVRVETRRGEHVLVHECVQCGIERRNRTAPEDSFQSILDIVRRSAESDS
jgi:hypothetical protein